MTGEAEFTSSHFQLSSCKDKSTICLISMKQRETDGYSARVQLCVSIHERPPCLSPINDIQLIVRQFQHC